MAELAGEIRGTRSADDAVSRSLPFVGWWASFRALPIARRYVLLLLVAVFAKQAVQVVLFPPFTGHDEVAHFAYLRTIADEHRIPIVPDLDEWRAAWEVRGEPPGDYIPLDLYPYQRYSLDWCCEKGSNNGDYDLVPPKAMNLPIRQGERELYPNGWQYAANHPPLFYVVMTPVYWATDSLSLESQQYALRAAVIPFWLAIVWLSYLIVRNIFPRDAFLAMTVPTFVAFQTQLSYEGAMFNNDMLSFAIFSLILYQLTRCVRLGFTLPRALGIGLVLGLGLLTKGTLITAAPLIGLAMVYRVGWRSVRRWAMLGTTTAATAAAISAPWFAFLYRTYGNLDGLDAIKALQFQWTYRRTEPPSHWDLFWNWSFVQNRWSETWAEFGWRLIKVDQWLLALIGIVCAALAVRGLLAVAQLYTRRRGASSSDGEDASRRHQRFALVLMVVTVLVAYGAVIQFGTQFALTQARYYFHALVPLAVILMLGLRQLLPTSWRPYGAGGVLVAMVVLNVVIYTQYVIPYWYLAS